MRSALGDLAAELHGDHFVADAHHHRHVVLDEQHREAELVADGADGVAEFVDLAVREAAGRLVHQEERRAGGERTRDLEEQNARRREFLYAIAHELRSPLTSIQAFAELLSSDRSLMEGDSDLLLSSLSRGVDRLAAFVNDLLDLGRVEEAYQEVAKRLGILPEAGNTDMKGPETMQ